MPQILVVWWTLNNSKHVQPSWWLMSIVHMILIAWCRREINQFRWIQAVMPTNWKFNHSQKTSMEFDKSDSEKIISVHMILIYLIFIIAPHATHRWTTIYVVECISRSVGVSGEYITAYFTLIYMFDLMYYRTWSCLRGAFYKQIIIM